MEKYIAAVESENRQEIVCCIPELQLPHIEKAWVHDKETVEKWVVMMRPKWKGRHYRIYRLVEEDEK